MTRQRIESEYVYRGLGFPLRLRNVPMVEIRGEWTPDIDWNELRKEIFVSLARKEYRLTGSQVKFVRHYCRMTLSEFGARFGVTHAAVKKWENRESQHTGMAWTTEKDIRLFVRMHDAPDPVEFYKTYTDLESVPAATRRYMEYDLVSR